MAKFQQAMQVSEGSEAVQSAATLNDGLARWAAQPLSGCFPDVLAHFLLSCRSPNTRSAYARDVCEFLSFAENSGFKVMSVADISERHVLLWKEALSQKHMKFDDSKRRVAQSSVARKLCTLSSLLAFACKRGLIEENPMALVRRPKVRRQSHAAVLTEEELSQILRHSRERLSGLAQSRGEDFEKSRRELRRAETEWCVLVLLFTVGMRVSELCQLKLKDLITEGDLLRIRLMTKGARRHAPLIHSESARVLLRFVGLFRAGELPDTPVFVAGRTSAGKILPLHRSTVFRMVRDAALRAGINRPFSPHGCRATLATQLHLAEVPVVEIQTLLNHAQVTTTQLYLHRIDDLRESAALKLPWAQQPDSARLKDE
jgi:integrase/recombinase XerD